MSAKDDPGAVGAHVRGRLRRLRLLLGGDDHLVDAGEAVEFDTWTPHWFGAADGPVELIGLFGPSGERVHVIESVDG